MSRIALSLPPFTLVQTVESACAARAGLANMHGKQANGKLKCVSKAWPLGFTKESRDEGEDDFERFLPFFKNNS